MTRGLAFAAGLLFALGLGLGGMTDPRKVIGFLDVAGAWDATLMFVMVGALAVMIPAWRLLRRRGALPTFDRTQVDVPLVAGSVIFGVGWGLSGYCPGPALVALASGAMGPLVVVAGMVVGMLAVRVLRP